jgi:peptide/nickel transport system substrate-binding protein
MIKRIRMATSVAIGIFIILMLAMSTHGASGDVTHSKSAAVIRGGNLVFGISGEPQDINPWRGEDAESIALWEEWFEFLLRPTPSGLGLEPQLATAWRVSKDNKTYTFQIRRNVKFHDGEVMTPSDVVWSLNEAFNTPTSEVFFLKSKIKSVTASGRTVTVRFKKPWPNLLEDLAGYNAVIVPHRLIQREGLKAFLRHPIGTGPFSFVRWNHGTSVVVKKFPGYWRRGLPFLDSITFRILSNDATRVATLRGGQIQAADRPPLNQVSTLATTPGLKVLTFPTARTDEININVTKPPLNNVKVRQALSLAIDRKAVVQAALFGHGTPARTFIVNPPSLTFANLSLNLYPYDPTKAATMLKAAGAAGKTLTLEVSPGLDQIGIAQVVKADLEKVGLHIKDVTKDGTTISNDQDQLKYQLSTSFWSSVQPDPAAQVLFTVDPAFCCKAFFTGWNNPKAIRDARAAASATGSRVHRQRLYNQVQRDVAQGMNLIPLYNSKAIYVARSNLHGFVATTFGMWEFEKAWLSR